MSLEDGWTSAYAANDDHRLLAELASSNRRHADYEPRNGAILFRKPLDNEQTSCDVVHTKPESIRMKYLMKMNRDRDKNYGRMER